MLKIKDVFTILNKETKNFYKKGGYFKMGMEINLDEYDLENIKEPEPVDAGEHNIRIISCVTGRTDKSGNPYIMPFFEVVDSPESKEFGYYMVLPNKLEGKKRRDAIQDMKNFLTAFGLETSGTTDTETWIGSEGWAILGIGEYRGKPVNEIRSFVAGH